MNIYLIDVIKRILGVVRLIYMITQPEPITETLHGVVVEGVTNMTNSGKRKVFDYYNVVCPRINMCSGNINGQNMEFKQAFQAVFG